MSDYTKDLEARLAAASIAWQDMNAADQTVRRLSRYTHLSHSMKSDLTRAYSRAFKARAELNVLLSNPHPIQSLPPASASQDHPGLAVVGGSTFTPRAHTGD